MGAGGWCLWDSSFIHAALKGAKIASSLKSSFKKTLKVWEEEEEYEDSVCADALEGRARAFAYRPPLLPLRLLMIPPSPFNLDGFHTSSTEIRLWLQAKSA